MKTSILLLWEVVEIYQRPRGKKFAPLVASDRRREGVGNLVYRLGEERR